MAVWGAYTLAEELGAAQEGEEESRRRWPGTKVRSSPGSRKGRSRGQVSAVVRTG